ncbi:GDP-mannose 4,6-dehydratase [Planktomarina temperata]|nr:GDP-mannose 4,6-dehydratase [Planktomarina temperata]
MKAFITGLTGQDGSYLAELLLEKGYEVHGIIRRNSVFTSTRIDHLMDHPNLRTYHGDLTDASNLNKLLTNIEPDEIYNLGAQSHVAVSFEVPDYTAQVDAIGTLRLLDAAKNLKNRVKFYQASTSELFGGLPDTAPQNEKTPFYPKSPYGAAKLYAYWIVVNFRESYNLYACNGILFNHESPRRGDTFVTKKIAIGVAKTISDPGFVLRLGNLDAKRDWGHAKDYVEAMWLMLQQKTAKDYVIATGETHTVREFVNHAYSCVNIELQWSGNGVNEQARCINTGRVIVSVDPRYYRPAEVELLHGDPALARADLSWKHTYSFSELVEEMVSAEVSKLNG